MRKFMKILVNLLTTARFFFTIIMVVLEKNISHIKFIVAIIILFSTDFIDGKLARKFKVQTLYGSNMDTIADKALSIGLILMLVKKISISWLPLLGEIFIAITNVIGKLQGKKTKSSKVGKAKTWLIAITTVVCYMNYFNVINKTLTSICCLITFLCQIYCLIYYINYLHNQKPHVKEKKKNNKVSPFYRLFSTEYYLRTIKD